MSAVSDEEIDKIISFMDPNGDGVSQEEFEDAFREGRRLKATAEAEEKGKELLVKLVEVLGEKTPAQWFEESNTEAMPGEDLPGLDTSEFIDALKKLGFRKKQTKYLKAYLDPDGDGDVDLEEFTGKIATMNEPLAMDEFNQTVGNAMDKLEKHMKKNYMRIIDLFRKADKDGGGEIDNAEMKAFFTKLAAPSKAALARAKKAAERKALSKPIPEEEPDCSKPPTGDAVVDLMSFLDPDSNGITKDELISGFREGRRARANAVDEAKGRRIFKVILEKIAESGKENGEWFDSVNTSATLPGGEPVIDGRELKRGIKKLNIKMSAKNFTQLMRFLDPSGSGDVSWGEFLRGSAALSGPSGADGFAADAGGTIMQLEAHMKRSKIRMLDLFRHIDKDGSGSIDNAELRRGLEKVAGSDGPIGDPRKKAPEADDAPPVSPRAKIEDAKAMDAKINPPPVASE